MQPFELLADPEEHAVRSFHTRQANIWTALPGFIESFDAASLTCTVQPTVKAVVFQNGQAQDVPLPLLLDCPVQFPAGGGYSLTFPVTHGDECLVIFASRCIDAWFASGGVQPQAEMRMHDLSDGFVILGFRSLPRVLTSINSTGAELRSDDGSTKVSLDSGQIVKIVAPGGCNINGLTIDSQGNLVTPGKMTATGTITTSGDVFAGAVSLTNHLTTGVTPGTGVSGPPQ
ncbi:MAG: Gp138 family membrane-puncturing spike protein [Nitrospirota bacterium]|nr:Gp138 family membrane-puncturing spike protein [Nitrospirota bacterium]